MGGLLDDINSDKIIITRKEKRESVQQNFRLPVYQIEKIEEIAQKSNRPKTEIMKIALDYFLQNVEVDTNKKEKK
jgi:hypothetical protein